MQYHAACTEKYFTPLPNHVSLIIVKTSTSLLFQDHKTGISPEVFPLRGRKKNHTPSEHINWINPQQIHCVGTGIRRVGCNQNWGCCWGCLGPANCLQLFKTIKQAYLLKYSPSEAGKKNCTLPTPVQWIVH